MLLLVLVVPFLSMWLGVSDAGNNPESFGTRRAYDLLAEGFGPGFNGPFILTAGSTPDDLQALGELSNTLAGMPDVARVAPDPERDHESVPGELPGAIVPPVERSSGAMVPTPDSVPPWTSTRVPVAVTEAVAVSRLVRRRSACTDRRW